MFLDEGPAFVSARQFYRSFSELNNQLLELWAVKEHFVSDFNNKVHPELVSRCENCKTLTREISEIGDLLFSKAKKVNLLETLISRKAYERHGANQGVREFCPQALELTLKIIGSSKQILADYNTTYPRSTELFPTDPEKRQSEPDDKAGAKD